MTTKPIVDATSPIGMPPPDGQRTDGRKLMDIPLPIKCISPRYELNL